MEVRQEGWGPVLLLSPGERFVWKVRPAVVAVPVGGKYREEVDAGDSVAVEQVALVLQRPHWASLAGFDLRSLGSGAPVWLQVAGAVPVSSLPPHVREVVDGCGARWGWGPRG